MPISVRCIFISLLCLLAASSSRALPPDRTDPSNAKDSVQNYYPLVVGNKWTYKVTAAGNSITVVSVVAKMDTINGLALARVESSFMGTGTAAEHLRQTKDGVFRHYYAGQECTPPLCVLKYPLKSGSTWSGEFAAGNDKGKYSCRASEDEVEVPAGKFKAMRVAMKAELAAGTKVDTDFWFVKDIGYVKQTVDTGGVSLVMELEKFDAGKK